MTAPLRTERLVLTPQSPDDLRATIAALSDEDRASMAADWLARAQAATESDPWIHGFVATARDDGRRIGQCGFRAPPENGEVEVAYGVEPQHEGQGFATEMAGALVAFARSSPDVQVVIAHTRPEANASTRVLEKNGFVRVGEVVDPEDGTVWRWRLR